MTTVRYHQGSYGPVYVVDGVSVEYRHTVHGTSIICVEHGDDDCEHKTEAMLFRAREARENYKLLTERE